MVASLQKTAHLKPVLPDDTTLCRHKKSLAAQIPTGLPKAPSTCGADSTGNKALGDGDWQARQHGIQGRHRWRKVHLARDTATPDIRAVKFTPSRDGDAPVLPELRDHFPTGEEIGPLTTDGAHDMRRCHKGSIPRQAPVIILIRKNGRPWTADCPAALARSETLHATGHDGGAFWQLWTAYHVRSRIRARMRCLWTFGEAISAKDPDRQTAEIQIRIVLMNRFCALGTAEINHPCGLMLTGKAALRRQA